MSQDFTKPIGVGGMPSIRLPGQPEIEPAELYRRLGRIIEAAPEHLFAEDGPFAPNELEWIGQASALISAVGDLTLNTEIQVATNGLTSGPADRRMANYQKLMFILYKALAMVEMRCPPGVQGSFIPAGSPYEAFEAVAKVFRTAKTDILIVDPYLDATVLRDFCTTAPEQVRLRLLTDEEMVRPDLEPAGRRWKEQHPARPIEIRLAPPRALHDRAFLVDRQDAWTVTQSLKDFATRAHGEIVRAVDIAPLKIAAYEKVWLEARQIV
jgi:hypothetical protein